MLQKVLAYAACRTTRANTSTAHRMKLQISAERMMRLPIGSNIMIGRKTIKTECSRRMSAPTNFSCFPQVFVGLRRWNYRESILSRSALASARGGLGCRPSRNSAMGAVREPDFKDPARWHGFKFDEADRLGHGP